MENVKQETRTIHDPFLGKDVSISERLIDRLRGKYAMGPTMENGEPEFGWRQFETVPIQLEAANRIEELVANNDLLNEDLRICMAEAESWRARCAELEALLP